MRSFHFHGVTSSPVAGRSLLAISKAAPEKLPDDDDVDEQERRRGGGGRRAGSRGPEVLEAVASAPPLVRGRPLLPRSKPRSHDPSRHPYPVGLDGWIGWLRIPPLRGSEQRRAMPQTAIHAVSMGHACMMLVFRHYK